MLDEIRQALRIKHTSLDNDINRQINACISDLKRVGILASIASTASTDSQIFTAVEFYCKWMYDFNSKGEQFEKAYVEKRDSLSMGGDYIESDE